jgi:hypothetical protein
MTKPAGIQPPPQTHFEQVPLEIVKKIIDAPKQEPPSPPTPLRIAP